MSTPELPIPNPELTQEVALIMILSSIVREELALSQIMQAEGGKLRQILMRNNDTVGALVTDVMEINKSVANLLEMVMQNEITWKGRMEKMLDTLPPRTVAKTEADLSLMCHGAVHAEIVMQ